MAGDTEELRPSEGGFREHFGEHLQRSASMGPDLGRPFRSSQDHSFHGQGTDVHAHTSQRVCFGQPLLLNRIVVSGNKPTYASKPTLSKTLPVPGQRYARSANILVCRLAGIPAR